MYAALKQDWELVSEVDDVMYWGVRDGASYYGLGRKGGNQHWALGGRDADPEQRIFLWP